MSTIPDEVYEIGPDTFRQTLSAGTRVEDPSDAEAWLKRLDQKLRSRADKVGRYQAYYDGRQRLAFATEQFRQAFGDTFKAFADNWMQIVVDAVDERLNVQGFRVPSENTEDVTTGDSEAWDIWQANDLDAASHQVHECALVDSIAYVAVGPPNGSEYPVVTGESALQVITECAPGYRRNRLAGLKRWRDDVTGLSYATVYLPDAVFKYQSENPTEALMGEVTWVKRLVPSEEWPLPNPFGVVPIIPFPNRPRLLTEGRSEIEQLIPLQDAINKLFMDMLVASEFAGFPQRVATGIELPKDPETGQVMADALKMSMDRFLHTRNADARFDTLEAADLANYTNAIAMAIQHLASRSSTPPHYFLAHEGNFPSGESLKAAETGLVSKVRRRMRHFGEAWEEVMRLAFVAAGSREKADAAQGSEVIWADPESRTESEHIDAIVKMSALGVPEEILWEKSGLFSPQEIARMKQMRAEGAPVATPPADTGTQ